MYHIDQYDMYLMFYNMLHYSYILTTLHLEFQFHLWFNIYCTNGNCYWHDYWKSSIFLRKEFRECYFEICKNFYDYE